jgi:RpiB/LacA/LacB family sugar-phosphate isomerase
VIWLFVCTGNTCRSPMAAAIARRRLDAAGRPDVAVFSAGLSAVEGEPAAPEAVRAVAGVAAAAGTELAAHRARRLDAADVFAADRVFTMTRAQAEALCARYPDHAARIGALDPGADVPDPFGRGQEAYQDALARIDAAVAAEVARHAPLRVAATADGAGAELRDALVAHLRQRPGTAAVAGASGWVVHAGAFAAATAAAETVRRGLADLALVVARPAAAACVAANRVPGARAAWCRRLGEATAARAECDANVLCLAPRGRGAEGAAGILAAFLATRCRGGPALAWLAELRRRDGTAAGADHGPVQPPP